MRHPSARFVLTDRAREDKQPCLLTGVASLYASRGTAVARALHAPAFASVSFAPTRHTAPGSAAPLQAASIQTSRILIHEGRIIHRLESDGTWRQKNAVCNRQGVASKAASCGHEYCSPDFSRPFYPHFTQICINLCSWRRLSPLGVMPPWVTQPCLLPSGHLLKSVQDRPMCLWISTYDINTALYCR
jgi:hypothetical protein